MQKKSFLPTGTFKTRNFFKNLSSYFICDSQEEQFSSKYLEEHAPEKRRELATMQKHNVAYKFTQ